jgi:hypothetical protein
VSYGFASYSELPYSVLLEEEDALSPVATDGGKATDASTTVATVGKAGTDGAKAGDSSTPSRIMARAGTDGAKAVDTATVVRTRLGVGTDGAKGVDAATSPRTRLGVGTDGATVEDEGTEELAAIASAILSGTATVGIDESDLVAGGKTLVLTLTGDTWIPI